MAKYGAFTLIELLVVIAIISVLASLLLPALSRAKAQAQGVRCLGNLKQFQVAWQLYADDNRDNVVPNYGDIIGGANTLYNYPRWVDGRLDYTSNPDNTNTINLLVPPHALLGPYVRAANLFRCPGDKSSVVINGSRFARVRSYSMNHVVGSIEGVDGELSRHYFKTSDFTDPGPSKTFVFLDEHEDTVFTGLFLYYPFYPDSPSYAEGLIQLPSSRHSGAGPLSFVDGHVEMHRWLDPRTRRPVTGVHFWGDNSVGNVDVRWITEHGTFKAN